MKKLTLFFNAEEQDPQALDNKDYYHGDVEHRKHLSRILAY